MLPFEFTIEGLPFRIKPPQFLEPVLDDGNLKPFSLLTQGLFCDPGYSPTAPIMRDGWRSQCGDGLRPFSIWERPEPVHANLPRCPPCQLSIHTFADHRQISADGVLVHKGMGRARPARFQSANLSVG